MRLPYLKRDELATMLARAKSGDRFAMNRICETHTAFVKYRVFRWIPLAQFSPEDLMIEGLMGIVHAVSKFKPGRSSFLTYATNWVDAYIRKWLISNANLVVRPKTNEERSMMFSRHRSESMTLKFAPEISMQKILSETGSTLEDCLAAQSMTQDEMLQQKRDDARKSRKIRAMLSKLKPKEAKVIEMRCLREEQPTLAEVGEEFGVSRERIRQIEAQALRKLKQTG